MFSIRQNRLENGKWDERYENFPGYCDIDIETSPLPFVLRAKRFDVCISTVNNGVRFVVERKKGNK